VRDTARIKNLLCRIGLRSDRAQRRSDRLRNSDQECFTFGTFNHMCVPFFAYPNACSFLQKPECSVSALANLGNAFTIWLPALYKSFSSFNVKVLRGLVSGAPGSDWIPCRAGI